MPIYDFECSNCGAVHEDTVPSQITLKKCPLCGDLKARRLVSAPKIGGVAADKIRDRAMRGGASATMPVSVSVPKNYKKKNVGSTNEGNG